MRFPEKCLDIFVRHDSGNNFSWENKKVFFNFQVKIEHTITAKIAGATETK